MPLAAYTDANAHLDGTKLVFDNDADAAPDALAADRLIRGMVGSLFPDQVALWDYDPGMGELDTPELLREVASLLMASYRYARKYSEDTEVENDHASRLEDRAMMILNGVIDGSITLTDVEYPEELTQRLRSGDFYPNDAAVLLDAEQGRKFGMSKIF